MVLTCAPFILSLGFKQGVKMYSPTVSLLSSMVASVRIFIRVQSFSSGVLALWMIFPSLSSFGFPEVSSDVVTMISRVRPIHKGASDFVLVNSVPSAKVTLYIFAFRFFPGVFNGVYDTFDVLDLFRLVFLCDVFA